MSDAQAPLDPDPFITSDAKEFSLLAPAVLIWRHPRLYLPSVALSQPCSLTAVAYIPPGYLRGKFAVFADDSVTAQPSWLSEAVALNRFRFLHGLRISALRYAAFVPWPLQGTLLAKSNPTSVRYLPLLHFRAPVEYSTMPTNLVPPAATGHHIQLLMVASSHGRSKNGFLSTRFGAYVARLCQPDTAIPQIGISLQIWVADDGCKCIAAAHNHFPQYDLYVDGIRVKWESEPAFERFDAYDIPVEWRAFLAFRLHDALRPFPLVERYPGACLIGWYRNVDPTGTIEWCDQAPPPFIVRFAAPDSRSQVEAWWSNLERLTVRLEVLLGRDELKSDEERTLHPSWSEDDSLVKGWRALVSEAEAWRPRGTA